MRITSKTSLSRRGDLAAHIRKLADGLQGPRAVKVGFPSGKAETAAVLDIAVWNHFGTQHAIPARPFISVAMFRRQGEIAAEMRGIARRVVDNDEALKAGLARLGELGQSVIRDELDAGTLPADAPATVEAKGSATPLVDSGRLSRAVTWDYDSQ